jgi:hypothetical protein
MIKKECVIGRMHVMQDRMWIYGVIAIAQVERSQRRFSQNQADQSAAQG